MDDDTIQVNCGRCGKPLVVRLEDLRDKRTVECEACLKKVKTRPA